MLRFASVFAFSFARDRLHLGHVPAVARHAVGRCTGPGPLFGAFDQAGLDGVPLDVSRDPHQVSLAHHKRREPPLPKAAAPTFTEVDHMRVAAVNLSDRTPQPVSRRGNENQMHVIGHETVRPDPNIKLTAPLAQQRKVRLVIFIAEKRLHPTIPALGDMMSTPRSHYSR